jgi:N-acetylglucosaminyldiphosphoundecaprenol N-acetyl-beta-D-mannosaminyltransferase
MLASRAVRGFIAASCRFLLSMNGDPLLAPHSEGLDSRVNLLGVPLDAVTEETVVHSVVDSALSGQGGWVCPVNLDVLRHHSQSAEVREILAAADVRVADGMPLLWASRLAGTPLPERVAGSSLLETLPPYAAEQGARLFFLGGNEGAAEQAAERLRAVHHGLQVVGTYAPPFGFERDDAELRRIERLIAEARPQVVFVGLGFPKQERLIARLRSTNPDAWYVSCGVSFSFVSGQIRRAPVLMQRLGLEWLHRLAQEPGRLARRYLVDGPPSLMRLLGSALAARRRRHDADAAASI